MYWLYIKSKILFNDQVRSQDVKTKMNGYNLFIKREMSTYEEISVNVEYRIGT